MLLEVIVLTVADARAAAEGGADRLEVVRAIRDGGLTPPAALVRAIAAETALPLRVMVRENAGYAMDPSELAALRHAARELAAMRGDTRDVGLVIGFANGGKLQLDDLRRVLEAAPGVPATFHRAFDSLRDPLGAIDALGDIPQLDRILTSGGDGSAEQRGERLAAYVERAGTRLTIVAGGGVTEDALATFAGARCVREVHVGRAARDGRNPEAPVSAARVRRLRALADGLARNATRRA